MVPPKLAAEAGLAVGAQLEGLRNAGE